MTKRDRLIERNPIEIIRCPALGGQCVATEICKGFESEEESLLPCPCFVEIEEEKILCQYPRYVSNKDKNPSEKRRSHTILTKEHGAVVSRYFTVLVHKPQIHGGEWKTAQKNLDGKGKLIKHGAGLDFARINKIKQSSGSLQGLQEQTRRSRHKES